MMKENNSEKISFSLSSLIDLCKYKKKFLILFIGIIVILTGIYSYIVPQKFTASASVLPPEEESSGGGLSSFLQSISGGISLGGLAKGTKIELYLEMLTSRTVAEYIVNECKLDKYREFKFENKDVLYDVVRNVLEVEANRSGLMIVSATIATPYFPNAFDKKAAAELASEISNAAVKGLDQLNRTKSNTKAKKKKEFISKVLIENMRKLDSIDASLELFQQQNKVLSIDDQTQAIMENAVGVGVELSKAEVELGIIKQEFNQKSPIVKSYQTRVNDLKNQYEKTQIGGLIPTDKFSIPLQDVPKLIRIYTNLLRDQKIMTQVILYLETQKYQEAMQEVSDIPTLQPLDNAYPPYKRSSPSRLIMVMLALFLSSFLGIFLITARAFYQGKLYFEKIEN